MAELLNTQSEESFDFSFRCMINDTDKNYTEPILSLLLNLRLHFLDMLILKCLGKKDKFGFHCAVNSSKTLLGNYYSKNLFKRSLTKYYIQLQFWLNSVFKSQRELRLVYSGFEKKKEEEEVKEEEGRLKRGRRGKKGRKEEQMVQKKQICQQFRKSRRCTEF